MQSPTFYGGIMIKRNPLLFDVLLFIVLIALLTLSLAGGCSRAHRGTKTPDSLPAASSSADRVGIHVDSAERLNAAAKPLAGQQARPLMDQVSAEHVAAGGDLAQTKKELAAVAGERDQLEAESAAKDDQIDKLTARIKEITGGWGYRLQLWATRFAWLIAAATLFHVIGRPLALFIPGPIGAGLAAASTFVNPLGWIQSAADNYWFRSQGGPALPPGIGITPAPAVTPVA